MPDCLNGVSVNNKRKRSNQNASNDTPTKKSKPSTSNEKTTPRKRKTPTDKNSAKKKKKKRRVRRKTSGIRQKICALLERALVRSPKLARIDHLFTSRDHNGNPRALLLNVLRTLQLSTKVKNIHYLTQFHWKSISNITDIFKIEEDEPGLGLYLKYRPIYNANKCTVYVDNLPEGCKMEKLKRLVSCYGNVADIRVPTKTPKMIEHVGKNKPSTSQPVKKMIDVGSRPKSYAFVRFVTEEAAENMIKKFKLNDPTILFEYTREDHEILQKTHTLNDFYIFKLKKEIRFLRNRRKHRPYWQVYRLAKLRTRLEIFKWKEKRCWNLANKGLGHRIRRNSRRKYQRERLPSTSAENREMRQQNHLEVPQINVSPPIEIPEEEVQETPRVVRNGARKRRSSLLARKLKKKRKKGSKKKEEKEEEKKVVKKKRKKRKYMSRKLPEYIPGRSVAQYFEQVQVFSYERYEELRKEYLELIEKTKSEKKNKGNN